MNERINTLIKQSYVTVQSPSGEGYTHFSQEKFAELIVRECSAKAWFAEQYDMGDGVPISKQIIEHFGIDPTA